AGHPPDLPNFAARQRSERIQLTVAASVHELDDRDREPVTMRAKGTSERRRGLSFAGSRDDEQDALAGPTAFSWLERSLCGNVICGGFGHQEMLPPGPGGVNRLRIDSATWTADRGPPIGRAFAFIRSRS